MRTTTIECADGSEFDGFAPAQQPSWDALNIDDALADEEAMCSNTLDFDSLGLEDSNASPVLARAAAAAAAPPPPQPPPLSHIAQEESSLESAGDSAAASAEGGSNNAFFQLHDLKVMVQEALQVEAHVLTEEELEVLTRFASLSDPAKLLASRLYGRRRGWVRCVRLAAGRGAGGSLAEIAETAAELDGAGALTMFDPAVTNLPEMPGAAALLKTLTAKEAAEVLRACGVAGVGGMHKEALDRRMREVALDDKPAGGQLRLSFVSGPSKAAVLCRREAGAALGRALRLRKEFVDAFRVAHELFLLQHPSEYVEAIVEAEAGHAAGSAAAQLLSDTGHLPVVLYTGLKRWPTPVQSGTERFSAAEPPLKSRSVFADRAAYDAYRAALSGFKECAAANVAYLKNKDKDECLRRIAPHAEVGARALRRVAGLPEDASDVDVFREFVGPVEQPPATPSTPPATVAATGTAAAVAAAVQEEAIDVDAAPPSAAKRPPPVEVVVLDRETSDEVVVTSAAGGPPEVIDLDAESEAPTQKTLLASPVAVVARRVTSPQGKRSPQSPHSEIAETQVINGLAPACGGTSRQPTLTPTQLQFDPSLPATLVDGASLPATLVPGMSLSPTLVQGPLSAEMLPTQPQEQKEPTQGSTQLAPAPADAADGDGDDDASSDCSMFSFERELRAVVPDEPCKGCGRTHADTAREAHVFSPAYVHRLMLLQAVTALELTRAYPQALHYLSLIMLCPLFNARRRGRLWQRIVIDSAHVAKATPAPAPQQTLRCAQMAAALCRRAVAERESWFMAGSDRLWLERRYLKESERVVKLLKGSAKKGADTPRGEEAPPQLPARPDGAFGTEVEEPTMRHVLARKWRGSKWPMWDLGSSVVHPTFDPSLPPEERNKSAGGSVLLEVTPLALPPPSLGGVEDAALAALCRHLNAAVSPTHDGWTGSHTEGAPLRFLFTLLMWDVLFGDAGRLPLRFMSAPIDWGTALFLRRRPDVERRAGVLRGLSREALCAEVAAAYDARHGICAFNCDWGLEKEVLVSLASCLGPTRSAALCVEFSTQMQFSGMPDLLLWNPITSEVLLSEVKGPGDVLSTKQEIWLTRLAAMGIESEVCRVIDVETLKPVEKKPAKGGARKRKRDDDGGSGSPEPPTPPTPAARRRRATAGTVGNDEEAAP
eukprot:Rhum_TRINITY_DN13128_c0_g1::Rhum_TRINITY_DN13128_c0_g1_i1::g.56987::m.56987/K15363/FAN1, MTMR15; fanconi-associated nuclease 1